MLHSFSLARFRFVLEAEGRLALRFHIQETRLSNSTRVS